MMGRSQTCVAAVQWARESFASLGALVASLHGPLEEATRAGAEVVVFGGGVDEALAGCLARAAGIAPGADAGTATDVFQLHQTLGDELGRQFESLGRSLARANRVTLALGSVLVGSTAGPHRVAYLFGSAGELLGTQAQTHRTAAERARGLLRGTTLAPVATPLGSFGLVTGVDVEYPEVSRILCLQGATLLLHQGALGRWNEALALSRLWREVQANQVFGVEAYGVGQGSRGRSAVHAPVEMVSDGSGWLARAPDAQRPSVVVADLSWARLQRVVEAYPIHALRNVAQYRRYFPALYQEGAGHGGA